MPYITVNRRSTVDGGKGDNVSEEDSGIPDLPSSDLEAGVLPTEIKKLVDSRKAVKGLLKDTNLTQDQRMQYDIRLGHTNAYSFSPFLTCTAPDLSRRRFSQSQGNANCGKVRSSNFSTIGIAFTIRTS